MALIDIVVAGVDGRPDDFTRGGIRSDEGDFRHGASGRGRDASHILRAVIADRIFLLEEFSQRHYAC